MKWENKIRSVACVFTLLNAQGIVLYSALAVLHSALIVLIPFGSGAFIDTLIYGGKPCVVFGVIFALALVAFFLNTWAKGMSQRIARKKELDLQFQLLDAFQSMTPGATDGYKSGEVAMKFFRDANMAYSFLGNAYPMLLGAVTSILFSLAMVLYKNSVIAWLYFVFLPFMVFVLLPYAGHFRCLNRSIRALYDKSTNGIFEFMRVFPFLKSIDAGDGYILSPQAKFRAFHRMNRKNDRYTIIFEAVNKGVLFLGEYSILGVAGWLAWRKLIPVGDVVVFQVLFLSVLNAFSGLFQILPSLSSASESVCSMNELLKSKETENVTSGEIIPVANGDILVRHLSFAYPQTERLIFDDFSCRIKGGSIVAITGANGTGKTTFLRLITGYIEPQSGRIEIAGKSLKEWQRRSFRRKIAAVFQDSLLISGTIRDNITLKNEKYAESEIAEAVRLSGMDSVIARLPEGLEHRIGIDGGGLSGGERQKLAIARALIRKPDILIFDEVTNHLDCEARCKVENLIDSLRGKITLFLVSHDPEIIALCDQQIELTA